MPSVHGPSIPFLDVNRDIILPWKIKKVKAATHLNRTSLKNQPWLVGYCSFIQRKQGGKVLTRIESFKGMNNSQENQIKSIYQIQFSQEIKSHPTIDVKLPSSSFTHIYFSFTKIIDSTHFLAKVGQHRSINIEEGREVPCRRVLPLFFTLKLNNFREALIIIKYSSMSKNSSQSNIYTQQHQSQSNPQEISSSNFSFSKTKKSERKTHKKKITKIVHTLCFYKTTQEGRHQAVYHQHIAETALRNKEAINKLAKRQSQDYSLKTIELAKKEAGFPQKVQKPKEVKIQEQFTVPYPYRFLPEHVYFIC